MNKSGGPNLQLTNMEDQSLVAGVGSTSKPHVGNMNEVVVGGPPFGFAPMLVSLSFNKELPKHKQGHHVH